MDRADKCQGGKGGECLKEASRCTNPQKRLSWLPVVIRDRLDGNTPAQSYLTRFSDFRRIHGQITVSGRSRMTRPGFSPTDDSPSPRRPPSLLLGCWSISGAAVSLTFP